MYVEVYLQIQDLAGQPATGVWTSQISYEAVASVVRELKMCLKR